MSSRARSLIALSVATLVLATPLTAQLPDSVAALRALLARVSAELGAHQAVERIEASNDSLQRLGRVLLTGNVALVVLERLPEDEVRRVAGAVDSSLTWFGGIPDSFTRSIVQRMTWVSDVPRLLALPSLRGRTPINAEWGGELTSFNSARAALLEPLATAFVQRQLDDTWRAWLPRTFGVNWDDGDAEGALDELAAASAYIRGRECLAGRLASCRLWLGIDDDSLPYSVRFTRAELVEALRLSGYVTGPEGRACQAGNGDACARFLAASERVLFDAVPAPPHIRASLVRSLRVSSGPEAMRRAFADSTGSIGARMARAAGVPEDSLVDRWRTWVLSRGRAERVSAGAGDIATALAFTFILLGMAVRSGRWR